MDFGDKAVKTPVSVVQELCAAFTILGIPKYNLAEVSGEAHTRNFKIELTLTGLEVLAIGEAKSKVAAKHEAASDMIQKIQDISTSGEDHNGISCTVFLECSKWLNSHEVGKVASSEANNSAGILSAFALSNDIELPNYELISLSGPAHNRTFVMMCKMKENVTQGEGKSKKIAKNIAAEKMLQKIGIDN